jgi:hypothetical protein
MVQKTDANEVTVEGAGTSFCYKVPRVHLLALLIKTARK